MSRKTVPIRVRGGRTVHLMINPSPGDLGWAFQRARRITGIDQAPLFFGLDRETVYLSTGDATHADIIEAGQAVGQGFQELGNLCDMKPGVRPGERKILVLIHGGSGDYDYVAEIPRFWAMFRPTDRILRPGPKHEQQMLDRDTVDPDDVYADYRPGSRTAEAEGSGRQAPEEVRRAETRGCLENDEASDFGPATKRGRKARESNRSLQTWSRFALRELEKIERNLTEGSNYDAFLRDKIHAARQRSEGDPVASVDVAKDRHFFYSVEQEGGLHVKVTSGDRSLRIAWKDHMVPCEGYLHLSRRDTRTVHLLDTHWSDGEEIDPVDRVLSVAGVAAWFAREGDPVVVEAPSIGYDETHPRDAEDLPASRCPSRQPHEER